MLNENAHSTIDLYARRNAQMGVNMKHKVELSLILAVLGGLFLAIPYVNPYSGQISLSELVLQLSGSSGEFALGFSLQELVALFMRMIPSLAFQIYFGTMFYSHFCTASTYVFSRYPGRLCWYFKEVLSVGSAVCLYQAVQLATVLLITVLRYQLQNDRGGIALLGYHLAIQAMWIFSMTLIVNLIAIWVGSSASFLGVAGMQMICITLLGLINMDEHLDVSVINKDILLIINPIAHLVLGWHKSNISEVNQMLDPPYIGIDLNLSMLLMLIICIVTVLLGAIIVQKHDLLIVDSETGVL